MSKSNSIFLRLKFIEWKWRYSGIYSTFHSINKNSWKFYAAFRHLANISIFPDGIWYSYFERKCWVSNSQFLASNSDQFKGKFWTPVWSRSGHVGGWLFWGSMGNFELNLGRGWAIAKKLFFHLSKRWVISWRWEFYFWGRWGGGG